MQSIRLSLILISNIYHWVIELVEVGSIPALELSLVVFIIKTRYAVLPNLISIMKLFKFLLFVTLFEFDMNNKNNILILSAYCENCKKL